MVGTTEAMSTPAPSSEQAILVEQARTQLRMLLVGALRWRSALTPARRRTTGSLGIVVRSARISVPRLAVRIRDPRREQDTSASTTTHSAAETANAQCMPPSAAAAGATPSAISESARLAMIITTSAVPMAPPTCWTVPSSELPWE